MSSPSLDALPEALSGHVGYLLVRLGKHAQRRFSLAIEPLQLRPAQADVLFVLADRGALAQTEIAGTLSIERAHLVALLDQLEALDLVTRDVDPLDRRRHAVRLTAKGTRTTAQLGALAAQVETGLLEGLTKAECVALRKTLQRLARYADEGD